MPATCACACRKLYEFALARAHGWVGMRVPKARMRMPKARMRVSKARMRKARIERLRVPKRPEHVRVPKAPRVPSSLPLTAVMAVWGVWALVLVPVLRVPAKQPPRTGKQPRRRNSLTLPPGPNRLAHTLVSSRLCVWAWVYV